MRGVKAREHSAEVAVKAFKAYIYSLRNGVAVGACGWKLADVEDSKCLQA